LEEYFRKQAHIKGASASDVEYSDERKNKLSSAYAVTEIEESSWKTATLLTPPPIQLNLPVQLKMVKILKSTLSSDFYVVNILGH
jgi:hypothetical protein